MCHNARRPLALRRPYPRLPANSAAVIDPVAVSDLGRTLLSLVRAHAPAATSGGLASDTRDAGLELRSDLGFDLIALAELAIAIEDALGIGIDLVDLDRCRTIGDLQALMAARVG